MQKKRIVVTLDPDYIPWEHNDDVVKLRRKRLHIPPLLIGAIAIVAILAFAIISKLGTDRQPTDVVTAPAPTVTPGVNPYADYCEYAGVLIPPGPHNIGGIERECKAGKLQ